MCPIFMEYSVTAVGKQPKQKSNGTFNVYFKKFHHQLQCSSEVILAFFYEDCTIYNLNSRICSCVYFFFVDFSLVAKKRDLICRSISRGILALDDVSPDDQNVRGPRNIPIFVLKGISSNNAGSSFSCVGKKLIFKCR